VSDTIGIIDCGPLVRLRRSFRYPWRLGLVLCFLFVAAFIAVLSGPIDPADPAAVENEYMWRRSRGVLLFLLIPTAIAFFRRDLFARLYFAIVAWLTAFIAMFFVLAGMSAGGLQNNLALIAILVGVVIAWQWFRSASALLRSVIPLRRWQWLREQLRITQSAIGERDAVARERPQQQALRTSPTGAFVLFITSSAIAWIVTLFFFSVLLMAGSNDEFLLALRQWDLANAMRIARTFQPDSTSNDLTTASIILQIVLILLTYIPAVIAGYLWHRWRRSRLQVYTAAAQEAIPPGSVLLLRHSNDDVMRIPTRNFSLARAPFMLYEWNYTLEELIATRLAHVGPLHALASARAQLQPLGAVRHRYSDEDWFPAVTASVPDARMVVTIMGAEKDGQLTSEHLRREMELLRDGGHLDKTLFLMPPIVLSWRLRARWRQFLDLTIPGASANRKLRRLAKRVLGVCFVQQMPVILTGSDQNEFFYESALDIAGALVTGSTNEIVVMKRLQLR
jgi:hypothetical protein